MFSIYMSMKKTGRYHLKAFSLIMVSMSERKKVLELGVGKTARITSIVSDKLHSQEVTQI